MVVELTPRKMAQKEYCKAMSRGAKGIGTLEETDSAWFNYRSLWDDEFAEEIRKAGSYKEWIKKFKQVGKKI